MPQTEHHYTVKCFLCGRKLTFVKPERVDGRKFEKYCRGCDVFTVYEVSHGGKAPKVQEESQVSP